MRVREAAREVKEGRAAYERDSVLFHAPEPPFPVLTGLLRATIRNGGRLSVLDFGGSLGSTYFQCRPFLQGLLPLRWNIVEQDAFVRLAQEFQNEELNFFRSIAECLERERPCIALLSGVLQYLENPFTVINEIRRHRFPLVLIDRTPFCTTDREFIAVQVVPPSIYDASYPFRSFRLSGLAGMLGDGYELVAQFPAVDGTMRILGETVQFKGAIFELTESSHEH